MFVLKLSGKQRQLQFTKVTYKISSLNKYYNFNFSRGF